MSPDLIVFLVLLSLGYVFGQINEKRHYRSIIQREKELSDVMCFSERKVPAVFSNEPMLVSGSMVVSVDYFKRFVANLRNLIGGRVSSYESLMDRARREAILRMKEDARKRGARTVWNVRLETASIYKGVRGQIGSVEVLAYGTALKSR